MERTSRTVWPMADSIQPLPQMAGHGIIRSGLSGFARRCRLREYLDLLNFLQGTSKCQWWEKSENKAVGVSRGGRNTKIHTLVDGLGNPLAFVLSSGNDHNSKHAVSLLGQVNIDGSNILGDKAYGAKAIRNYIDSHNVAYTIPPRSDVNDSWPVGWHTYKERHLVEFFFQKLKWFRRIFTRYDKLDASFLAFVHIAAIAILLK